MARWVSRLFSSWAELAEYFVFLAVAVLGLANASWLWVIIAAMVLLLIGWSRWESLFEKAGKIDADWRELGALWRTFGLGSGFAQYFRARTLPMVLAAKLGHDALFLAAAFALGHLARWMWFG